MLKAYDYKKESYAKRLLVALPHSHKICFSAIRSHVSLHGNCTPEIAAYICYSFIIGLQL